MTRVRLFALLVLAACLTGQDFGSGIPMVNVRPIDAPPGLCSTQSQLAWCFGSEYDSTADTCSAEQGYPAGGTPNSPTGLQNCENPTEGTTSDVGQIEGNEDLYFPAGVTNHQARWDSQFTSGTTMYVRACVQIEAAIDTFAVGLLHTRTGVAYWKGSGASAGGVEFAPDGGTGGIPAIRVSCPKTTANDRSGWLNFPAGRWHQITAFFDGSTATAPAMSLWLDKDSEGTPDLTCVGSVVTGVGAIDGFEARWNHDTGLLHFDFIQVDPTASDLVSVYGGDCVP
jgi:hypothetical protein